MTRDKAIRMLRDRDGWACRYCDRPFVDLDTPFTEEAHYTGIGCCLHKRGGPCAIHAVRVYPPEFAYAELEHLLPRARGGTDAIENLGLACGPCNNEKGARTEAEYLAVRNG